MTEIADKFNSLIAGYISRDGDIDTLSAWSAEDLQDIARLIRAELRQRSALSASGDPRG